MSAPATTLPVGTSLVPLEAHDDERGVFVELYRLEWETGVVPVQWNAVRSRAGVLRGVHVHIRHDDYLTVPFGRASVGLRDLRRGSPTEGVAAVVDLDGERPAALVIPHGVAHGFYFHEPSLHVYAVSEYWDSEDELGCHWADPELEIPWPCGSAQVSERDAQSPPLRELLERLAPSQPL
ncbi:MAG TPA: dTDP-4-dehydrorhamnose 3,5-epimerase family protein [Gaiellaceae bacterium]|nr:dTDP-4-dehydrorhamnose 3,5-epimerase family protein [Gaiellaceae bacterium]